MYSSTVEMSPIMVEGFELFGTSKDRDGFEGSVGFTLRVIPSGFFSAEIALHTFGWDYSATYPYFRRSPITESEERELEDELRRVLDENRDDIDALESAFQSTIRDHRFDCDENDYRDMLMDMQLC